MQKIYYGLNEQENKGRFEVFRPNRIPPVALT